MLSDNNLNAVCSITELVKKLALSRARFYQLQEIGIFPKPVYCIRTKRPFYPLDLQQKCIEIRKTGIGYNGQPIVFNSSQQNKSGKSQDHYKYEELTGTLRQMGLLNVTPNKVKTAVKTLYPEKLPPQPAEGRVLRELFRYFSKDCKNDV